LQKKAPKALKSLDAKLKSAPVAAGNAGELVGEGPSAGLERPTADRRLCRAAKEADWPHEAEEIFLAANH
jgi:hypothetical protein